MLINVPIEQIDDNPFQRRQDYGDVESLAADILARGLLQTPRGRLLFDRGELVTSYDLSMALHRIQTDGFPAGLRVQLAFGHRRLRAFRHLATIGLGWNTMPVYVEALTDDQMLDAVWSENQHRSDINAIEQAELLAAKLERARSAGGNQTTVAAEWNLDRSTIANKIRLLDLPENVQAAVRERRLSERQALALLPVVEVQAKMNGAAVEWEPGKNPSYYGTPIAPAAYIDYAVANPDKAKSDDIRDYARRAADHAGIQLPDYLATFDAGEGDGIVQPLCAGCRYRHNQHCLNRPCAEAKFGRFQEGIPLLAAELTGLPWSDDPTHFPTDWMELNSLYQVGQHTGLVVGWHRGGWYHSRPNGTGHRSEMQVWLDWHDGLKLGRLPEFEEEIDGNEPPQAGWMEIKRKASRQREERFNQAFINAAAALTEHADAVLPLLVLMNGYEQMPSGTPAEQLANIAEHRVRRLYLRDRKHMEEKLVAAGLNTAILDPTDPIERLREAAAAALEDWYDYRDEESARKPKAAKAIAQAAALFREHNIDVDDAELGDLALWLQRAEVDVAAVMGERVEQHESKGESL